jgi:putative membrane protein
VSGLAPALSLACAALAYAAGVRALHRRGRPWARRRTAAFAAGLLALAVALVSPIAGHDELFPVHMAQHVLLGMLGPLLLALSAPVTLALRTLPRPARRRLVKVLHSRGAAGLAHPATATVLLVAGLLGLYFTPLYGQTLRHPLLHELVHIHFLAAGCLFAWAFAGADPVPRRGSLGLLIGLLLAALGLHAALAKLLYAGYGHLPGVPAGQRHAGAQLMYYAGDAVDLLLLLAFFGRWYAAGGRRLERDRRRAAYSGARRQACSAACSWALGNAQADWRRRS